MLGFLFSLRRRCIHASFVLLFVVWPRPVSAAALSLLLRKGEVDGMTMAWTTGMGDWKPLGEVCINADVFCR